MWVSMGPIADRTHDRLGASDVAIVAFRKKMLDAIRTFEQGGHAIGTGHQAAEQDICAFQAIISKSVDWREYAAQPI